jgi:hypothetical protein
MGLDDVVMMRPELLFMTSDEPNDSQNMSTLHAQQPVIKEPALWVAYPSETLSLEALRASATAPQHNSSDRTHTDSTDGAPTETTAATEGLQGSPANSIRLKPSVQFDPKALDVREKENEVQPMLDRSKSFSRWTAKSNAKGNGKGHSIRGLFW